ncbi:MAG: hypothetical protein ACE5QV_04735, partial [Fidelibacterota bacterium]
FIAGRITYRPFKRLKLGVTHALDGDPYLNIKDSDGDGRPDLVDDFPDSKSNWKDTDGDGFDDSIDIDADGDNVYDPFDPEIRLKADPINLNNIRRESVNISGFDVGVPLLERRGFKIFSYGQYAKIVSYGWGFAFPGFRINLGPVTAGIEYRRFSKNFVSGFFNKTYELDRAVFREVSSSSDSLVLVHKAERVLKRITNSMRGYFSSIEINVMNLVSFYMAYQDMRSEDNTRNNSMYADIFLNTRNIPRIKFADAYYQQTDVGDPLDFRAKTESTILGYKIGYDLSPSVTLIFGYRETYRDYNGDGVISGKNEIITTTNLETVFSFR